VSDFHGKAGLVEFSVGGSFQGKVKRFDNWRRMVGDMIGAPIEFNMRYRDVSLISDDPAFEPPRMLQFIESKVTNPSFAIEITPQIRRGIWMETPDEPLWIVLLLTIPGGTFFSRHAQAIANRLDEIEEIVDFVDFGRSAGEHAAARAFFREQARSGIDVVVQGGFEPSGWWDVDLDAMD